MIQIFRPSITDREIEAVAEVMRSGWLGLGPKTAQFETEFAAYVGAEYAIGMNSGTAALHLALLALGIGPGDEVLVPTITFASTALAVIYCGATPVFVDVCPDTLCIDVADARHKVTDKTAAIMPVHYSGTPCDMNFIWELANDNELVVIEDAAHACGSKYWGEWVGGLLSISAAICFSFHAVKNLTCGEGGMVTCHDEDIADKLRKLRWCGIDKDTWNRTGSAADSQYSWYYEIASLGYKAHMNDIAAAIGLVQLDRLPELNARRREIAELYTVGLYDLDWLVHPYERIGCKSSWHAYVIKVPGHRNQLNQHLKECGVATGVHYIPLHLQPYFANNFPSPSLPVAERVWKTILTLPCYPDLTDDEVSHVIESIRGFKI